MPIDQSRLAAILNLAEALRANQDALKEAGIVIYKDPNPSRSWQSRFEDLLSLVASTPLTSEDQFLLYREREHLRRTSKVNERKREYMRRKRATEIDYYSQTAHEANPTLSAEQIERNLEARRQLANKLAKPIVDPSQPLPGWENGVDAFLASLHNPDLDFKIPDNRPLAQRLVDKAAVEKSAREIAQQDKELLPGDDDFDGL